MIPKESRKAMNVEDLVAVHMTNYFPHNGVIRSRNLVMPSDSLRNSVHFSMNHPVQGHNDGNWDNKSYAVFVPLDKLVHEEGNLLWNFNVIDTYFIGDVTLPKGTILVNSTPLQPTDEQLREMIEKGIRYAIGSRNIRRDIYLLIEQEGFQPMQGGMWDWGDYSSSHTINQEKIAEELRAQQRCHFRSDLDGIEWLSNNLRIISGKVGKKQIRAYLRAVEELGGADQFERKLMDYPESSDELEGRDILHGRNSEGSDINAYIRQLEIIRESLPKDYQRRMDKFLDANKAELRTFIPEAVIQQYQLSV